MRDRLRQTLNVVFAVTQVAAGLLPVMGVPVERIGDISDRYPTYAVPAGYTFSIWSLIFLLSILFAIYQALPSERRNPLFRDIGWYTASAFLAATVWLLVFPFRLFVVSV